MRTKMRQTKPARAHEGAHAVLDGLLRPSGALDAGEQRERPRASVRRLEDRNGAVVVTRPPVGVFICDESTCTHREGSGLAALYEHAALYGHTTFTAIDPEEES
jgi:hypothetical protein